MASSTSKKEEGFKIEPITASPQTTDDGNGGDSTDQPVPPSGNDSLAITEGVLGVTLDELPSDPSTTPVDQYPATFTPSGAAASDTTISSEMMNQYSSVLTLAGYQYRL